MTSTPPLILQDIPMDKVPAPSIKGSTAKGVSDTVNLQRSPTTPLSPAPSHHSSASTLTPLLSPAHSHPPHNATPN
ncbi:hypothetical protein PISMIDRAFT_11495 [Pisolithus microcarpus 441]|uniref:Uncharacterized protein n=1 Tax=Pisolithus microcarpus 441 TaxID=765257 RepID=A0A0C9Z9F9_9AGAM|nr:hypothetical protein PISMIDRAFT_11495 [Pisolithus microcarpus 441]